MMQVHNIALELTSSLELPVMEMPSSDRSSHEYRINGFDRPHGFSVVASELLSRVKAELRLDRLAADLLLTISTAGEDSIAAARTLLSSYESLGVVWNVSADGTSLTDLIERERSELKDLVCIATMLKADQHDGRREQVIVCQAVLSFLVALLPLDMQPRSDAATGPSDWIFAIEGGSEVAVVNKYERSRSNRAAAIAIHGSVCKVCGFNFSTIYGDLARDYIEVHHLTPVSMMESPRPVDPRTELVPLCANCHRMAHRRWPPYSPEELRNALNGDLSGRRN